MFRTVLVISVLVGACKSSDGDMDLEGKGSGSMKPAGSAGGLSADLSADLTKDGAKPRPDRPSTPDRPIPDKTRSATPDKTGSATPDKTGSATPDKTGSSTPDKVGSAAPDKVGSAAPDKSGSSTPDKSGSAAPDKSGSAAPDKSGSAAPDKSGSGSAKPGSAMPVPPPPANDAPRVLAKVSPELAAIKLSLDPNWERDVGDAGTISFVLKKPNGEQAIFSFMYGYDPTSAPSDRDAYMKWLGDQKLLTVELNRQRGSAWYLQGLDSTGAPAFRYLVNYGGKKLICGGLLYKDAESNRLGDLRDKVIIQAKEICETLAL